MAIQQGNQGIVKNGLELYYNREHQSSFKGEQTINLFSIPAGCCVSGDGNHAPSFITSTTTGVPDLYVPGNKQIPYISEYYTLVATGSWQGEVNRWIIYPKGMNQSSITGSTSYRLSFYARSISGNTQLKYAFYGNSANFTANLTPKWQRFDCTSTTNATYTAVEFGNLNTGSMICQIAGIQVESKSYTTPYTLPMNWTINTTNLTVVNGGGYAAWKKTSGIADSWNNARLYSSEGYSDSCYVSFKASQTGCPIMLGLNSDPGAGIDYVYLDYAWYVTWDGGSPVNIYENGIYINSYGAYTTSTVLEIIYDGVNVNYYKDGVLQRSVVRTSKTPLYLDSSFYSTANGGAVNSLSFGPLPALNRTSNTVIGGGGLLDLSQNNYSADLNSSAVSFDSGGFYFNGNNSGALTVPISNSTLDGLSNNTHTYEVWFKLLGTPPGTYDGYFFGRQGFHEGFAHYKSTPGTIFTITWYHDNNATSLGYTGVLNTWYHGVFVVNVETATRQLYINGSLVDSGTLTKQLKQYASTTAYYLGSASQDYASNVIVSSAKAYNRALTVSEVNRNFEAQRKVYGI